MINTRSKHDNHYADRFQKIAYYGSPILGARDLGMGKTFSDAYKAMLPFRDFGGLMNIPMWMHDAFIVEGSSSALLKQSWQEFWHDGPKTFLRMMALSCDDRWVPFAAFMDLLHEAFASQGEQDSAGKEQFHFINPMEKTCFFNLVGEHDSLVAPSASIVDWTSIAPERFKRVELSNNESEPGFEQVIFPGGHFIFAQPGFRNIKERLARWFAYYPNRALDKYPYEHSRHTRSIA